MASWNAWPNKTNGNKQQYKRFMSSPIGVSEWARYEASNRSVARERTLVRDQAMQGSQRSSLPIITHRHDIVVQTDKYVYIMELKMDATADEALKQIGH